MSNDQEHRATRFRGTRNVLRYLAAAMYVSAGLLHFLKPSVYGRIMPPFVPWPLAMVYVSGAAEIAGRVGLLIHPLRRVAAWALVALLIAVFPANVHMAVSASTLPPALLWARLPLQIVLIWWILWCTTDKTQSRSQ